MAMQVNPYQFTSGSLNDVSAYFNFQLTNASKISIAGSSNVNEFSCLAFQEFPVCSATMEEIPGNNHIRFKHTVMQVLVRSLNCDNPVMNYDMYEALQSESYPYITIALTEAYAQDGATINLSSREELYVVINLTITGHTQKQTLKISASRIADNRYRFYGSHTISLNDYHIEPPTALFGVIRVKDKIKIEFDLQVITM